ncbi:unnamed protein product [Clonostachys rhizophaga]|uniref:F-box domain-containing protein n=1 Tax=Clonostachys rhizophaga TaxID=160324 RepID=A0A9N9YJI8_9HYPO|nr:unnamed protein product [Clonostachys rhizophaga]
MVLGLVWNTRTGQHWLAWVVRGPQDPNSPEEPVLTGLGYMTDINMVAPADCAISYKETPDDELRGYDFRVLDGTTDRPFTFHEFCWQLLLTKLGLGEDKAGWKQVGTWLFHILNSVSWVETGNLMPENRYHGTIKLRQATAALGTPDLLLADPSKHGPEIATSSLEFQHHSLIQPITQQSDPFTTLPLEVIFEIFILLPSKDVGSARLSSRHLAVACFMNNLPQRFWTSRFSPERELGLVLPELLSPKTSNRWLHTYLDYKKTLKESNCFALRNRGRIWRCLEGLAIILDALLIHHRERQPEELVDETCFLGQKVACPELPDQFQYGELNFGARSREQHHFALQDAFLVQISVIRLDSATYISGIRTTSRANRDGEQVVQEAGLIIPSNLYSIRLLPGSTISSIDVYCSPLGIHGLAFSFTHSTNIQLVGDGHCPSNTVGVAKLTAQSGIAGIVVGFDVMSHIHERQIYKAVSIQLVEQQAVDNSHIPAVIAWNPRLPDTEITRRLPPLKLKPLAEDQFSVNAHIPFGGEDGSRLPLLCKMTALMHGRMGFYGLLFSYSDGKELWFGQREALLNGGKLKSCVEQTFMINGEAGECINSFDAPCSHTGLNHRHVVRSIQVTTNFGRQYTFGASTPAHKIEQQVSAQVPSQECRIIALVGRVSSPIWAFEDLKAEKIHVEHQIDRMPLESISAPSLTRNMITDVPWMLLYEGSCFTIASLENLRRVRVSKGAGGRSRADGNVTGILLDYHHGGQSAVVGQWIQEARHDPFSLHETERVVEFSYWVHANMVYPESDRFSMVTGIRLVTSFGQCLEVIPDHTRRLLDTHVRCYSTLYEGLRNITWIFNSSRDELNISLRPTPALGDGHLCLAYSREIFRPRHEAEGNTRIYSDFNDPVFDELSDDRLRLKMSYYHVRGLLFFHNIDSHGRQIPVQQVRLTAGEWRQLVGIEFQYADGHVNTYGTNVGKTSVLRLDTARNERLSRLVVYNYARESKGIELHTTLNQKLVAGRIRYGKTVYVATFPLEVGIAMPDFDVPDLTSDRVFNHGLPTLAAEEGFRGSLGIWVILKCKDDEINTIELQDAGPIYLTGPR